MRWFGELVPSGRLDRRGFWLRHLFALPAALFVCVAATDVLGRPLDLLPALLTALGLVSAWGRRLHDRGRSAWWLLSAALPLLGALWLLIECGLRSSGPGAEGYGPPPGVRGNYLTVGEAPTP
jgi:uncharacterized membrane protein YhaH (DUF805 family)